MRPGHWIILAAALIATACGGHAGIHPVTGACHGVQIGDVVQPTLAIEGSLKRTVSTRRLTSRDICAVYGPPRSIEAKPDGSQVWSYGPGTGIFHVAGLSGAPRRGFTFHHLAGTVTIAGSDVISMAFKHDRYLEQPIGG